MVTNGGDDPGSPWLRDDWTVPPARAFIDDATSDPRSADDFDGVRPLSTRTAGMRMIVGVAIAVVAVGGVVLVGDDEPDRKDIDPSAIGLHEALDDGPDDGPDDSRDEGIADGADDGLDVTPSTGPVPAASTPGPIVAGATADPTGSAVAASVPPSSVASLVIGEVPTWSETTIDVPSPLAEMVVPTELIVKTSAGLIRRIEIPTGRVRSLDASALGADFQVVSGRGAIAVHNASDVVILRDGMPATRTSIPDGVAVLGWRPGRDDFIVVTQLGTDSAVERKLIIGIDGTVTDAPLALAEIPFWAALFLPSGELVVDRPGGVYAIGDDGAAVRIDEGDLIATGSNHYAVERCTVSLACEVVVIDAATGATVTVGASIAGVITSDIGTRLSPDGASALHIAYGVDLPERRVADMASATEVAVGGVGQLVWGEAWASDSSGVFTERDGVLRFTDRVSGVVTELSDAVAGGHALGAIAWVTARPAG